MAVCCHDSTARFSFADRDRLVKILGRLGSDHAGERDAAALAAVRLLRERGLGWADVIAPSADAGDEECAPDWRELVADLLRIDELLTDWEAAFLRGLLRFPHLSPRQFSVLDGIAAKVRAAR